MELSSLKWVEAIWPCAALDRLLDRREEAEHVLPDPISLRGGEDEEKADGWTTSNGSSTSETTFKEPLKSL